MITVTNNLVPCGSRVEVPVVPAPLGPFGSRHRYRLVRPARALQTDPSHRGVASLTALKKEELKSRARALGLPTSGTKAELAARIAAKQAAPAPATNGPHGRMTMGQALAPGGPLSQALEGHLRSQLDQGMTAGSVDVQVHICPGGSPPDDGQDGQGKSRGPTLDFPDGRQGAQALEALGQQLSMQQQQRGEAPSDEKWIGEASVIQVAAGSGKGKGRRSPGSPAAAAEEDVKLRVLIRVVGRSRQEVEAALHEEAGRDRGGKQVAFTHVWKDSAEDNGLTDLLSACFT